MIHCDDCIDDLTLPECIRLFLLVNRLPAIEKHLVVNKYGEPKCFADYHGERVRLVMASRFGDVGITSDLKAEHGYQSRVQIDALSNFGESP